MTGNERVVRDFIRAWSKLDADQLVEFFTEDGVYHNMPTAPVSGRKHLRAFISAFLKGWSETEWDVRALVAAGDIVMVERLDRTKLGAKSVDLPCCGVFEMRDGKIKEWRDYFDMATFSKAMA